MKPFGIDCVKQKKRTDRNVSFSTEPPICLESQTQTNISRKKCTEKGSQTNKPLNKMKRLTPNQNYQREPICSQPRSTKISEPTGVIQKDYIVNPRIQTTYQHHFNDPADLRLGFCDNRSIEERHRESKERRRRQDDSLQSMKLKYVSNQRKYKSDCRQRISEYMAETSYIGGAIMKSGIHNHLKCPHKHCTHFITFK